MSFCGNLFERYIKEEIEDAYDEDDATASMTEIAEKMKEIIDDVVENMVDNYNYDNCSNPYPTSNDTIYKIKYRWNKNDKTN